MSETTSTFTVQVPARTAERSVPGKLEIGGATLEVGAEATTEVVFLGREARRFPARWSKRSAEGGGYIEIRPSSKLTSEIVIVLEAGRGPLRRLFGAGQSLRSLAELYAKALRYEIETRAAEDADAYGIRRTSAGLVRSRSA